MKTITVVSGLLLALALSSPALAQSGQHGDGHAENHDWYNGLKQPGGKASCCSNKDCRPTRAYVDDEGNWRAVLSGQWVTVPRDRVLSTKAPDGNSHICANDFGLIFCFIGGVPKS